MKFSEFWNLCYNSGLKTQKSAANFLGVTEQSITLWKKKNNVPSIYKAKIKKNENGERSKKTEFFEKIIQNQLDQIDLLKKENLELKEEKNDAVIVQKMIDDEHLSFHYETEVMLRIKNLKLERACLKVSNIDIQSKYLGYSVEYLTEIWDVGNWYPMHEHPIERIITDKTKEEFKRINERLTGFFQIFKQMKSISEVPMNLKINHLHNDGSSVPAIVSNVFNPVSFKVFSKISFEV